MTDLKESRYLAIESQFDWLVDLGVRQIRDFVDPMEHFPLKLRPELARGHSPVTVMLFPNTLLENLGVGLP